MPKWQQHLCIGQPSLPATFPCCSVVMSSDLLFCMLCRVYKGAQLCTKTDASVPILSEFSESSDHEDNIFISYMGSGGNQNIPTAPQQLPSQPHTYSWVEATP